MTFSYSLSGLNRSADLLDDLVGQIRECAGQVVQVDPRIYGILIGSAGGIVEPKTSNRHKECLRAISNANRVLRDRLKKTVSKYEECESSAVEKIIAIEWGQ